MSDITLSQALVNFKKILQIILQYDFHNKKILFIGVPQKLEVKINRLTNHNAISSESNILGFISNNFMRKKQNLGTNRPLSKLLKRPDLVVMVSHKKSENFLKECLITKIPVINFKKEISTRVIGLTSTYELKLDDNFDLSSHRNLFFIGLNFLFATKGRCKKL